MDVNRSLDAIRNRTVPTRPTRDVASKRRVQTILQRVEACSTFTIGGLAEEMQLSRSYLQRLFKQTTGVCLGVWLNEQRLQRAAFLLLNTSLSVKRIAPAVGYEHPSSFVRAFERRFQHPPTHYRRISRGRQLDC